MCLFQQTLHRRTSWFSPFKLRKSEYVLDININSSPLEVFEVPYLLCGVVHLLVRSRLTQIGRTSGPLLVAQVYLGKLLLLILSIGHSARLVVTVVLSGRVNKFEVSWLLWSMLKHTLQLFGCVEAQLRVDHL